MASYFVWIVSLFADLHSLARHGSMMRLLSFAAVGLHFFGVIGFAWAESDTSAKVLITRVLARRDAFVSGHLEYRIRMGRHGTDGLTMDNLAQFTFDDESWIIRFPSTKGSKTQLAGGSGAEVTHGSKHVAFTAVPQPNGSIRYSARVRTRNPIDVWFPSPPYFAGSIWSKTTADYVRSHIDLAVVSGTEKGETGANVTIVDIPVGKDDAFTAFRAVGAILEGGGLIRLHIDNGRGCVLPVIEFVGSNNMVEERSIAAKFAEEAPGIYVPHQLRQESYNELGTVTAWVEYHISKVSLINAAIDASYYTIELPAGTSVIDTRPESNGAHFTVGESIPNDPQNDLDDIFKYASANHINSTASGLSSRTILLISVNVIALIFAGCIWVRRASRRASTGKV